MFLFVFGILMLNTINALDTYGTFKQYECVRVKQSCVDSTYMILSSITYPNSSKSVENIDMNYSGNGEFYYEFCDTGQIGRYDVTGISDGTCENTFATYFEISSSGKSGASNIVFYIFIIALAYTITLLGFFKKNEEITILGGLFMVFCGVYLINEGMIIYRDDLTYYLATFTWAIGAILAMWATMAKLDVL